MRDGKRRVGAGLAARVAQALAAALGIGMLSGCGDEAGSGAIAYDTIGGVPAVINPKTGVLGDSVPVRFTEALRVSGDQLYDRQAAQFALDAGILPDGGFVVLDAGNRRVLRFGPEGDYSGAFGEEGEGPGQFRNPFMLEVADTLVFVLDIALNRVNAFRPDGSLATTFGIDLAGLAGVTPLFEAGGPDEVFVAGEPVPFPMTGVRDTGRAVIYRLDSTGAITDTLLTYGASTWTPIQLPGGRSTFAKPRFAPEPRLDTKGSLVVASYLTPYILDLRRTDGTPLRRIARDYENAPVVQSVRDSVLNLLASGPNRMPREALGRIPFESEIPAVESVALDDRGRVWVDPYVPDEPTRRDLFDPDGRFLGPVYLPEPMQIKDVRGDRLCGVASDPETRSTRAICYTFSPAELAEPSAAG